MCFFLFEIFLFLFRVVCQDKWILYKPLLKNLKYILLIYPYEQLQLFLCCFIKAVLYFFATFLFLCAKAYTRGYIEVFFFFSFCLNILLFQVVNNGGARYSKTLASLPTSRSRNACSDTSESENECSRDEAAHITELAQQLGRIGNSETLPTMSEHLQVKKLGYYFVEKSGKVQFITSFILLIH